MEHFIKQVCFVVLRRPGYLNWSKTSVDPLFPILHSCWYSWSNFLPWPFSYISIYRHLLLFFLYQCELEFSHMTLKETLFLLLVFRDFHFHAVFKASFIHIWNVDKHNSVVYCGYIFVSRDFFLFEYSKLNICFLALSLWLIFFFSVFFLPLYYQYAFLKKLL